MLFEITRSIGEHELSKQGIDIGGNLEEQLLKRIDLLSHFPKTVKEVVPINFIINEYNDLSFSEFETPISNITEDLKNKVFFKKGREGGGDYTPSSLFYLNKVDTTKDLLNNLLRTFFIRFMGTKTLSKDSKSIFLNQSREKYLNNKDYQHTLLLLEYYMEFMKIVVKANESKPLEKDLMDFIVSYETDKSSLFGISLIGDFEQFQKLKKKDKQEYLKNQGLESFYNHYYHSFNIEGLLQSFEEKYFSFYFNSTKEFVDKVRLATITFNGRFIGEFDFVPELVMSSIKDNYGKDDNSGYGCCSLCHQEKDVFGNIVSNLKAPFNQFSTFKEIYSSNGLDTKRFWANFPVCFDCGMYLEIGRHIIQSPPFRQNWDGLRLYTLPVADKVDFPEIYEYFKHNLKHVYSITTEEGFNYLKALETINETNQLTFFNMYFNDNGLHTDRNVGVYVLLADEPNDTTSLRKTMDNVTFGTIKNFIQSLRETKELGYFSFLPINGELIPYRSVVQHGYDFTNHKLKEICKFNLSDGSKEFNKRDYFSYLESLYSNRPVNTDKLIRKFNELLTYLYRNEDDNFKILQKFNELMFIYNVFLKTSGKGDGLNMKSHYEVVYSGENRNFIEKLNECAIDIGIQNNIEKALFMLGVTIPRIISAQKKANLTGSFVKHIQRKITSHRDIIKLYNLINEMVMNKYPDELGHLNPLLQEVSVLLSGLNSRFDKEMATFRLLQGYNLNSRFVTVKKEDAE